MLNEEERGDITSPKQPKTKRKMKKKQKNKLKQQNASH